METKTGVSSVSQNAPTAIVGEQSAPPAAAQQMARSVSPLGGLFGVYSDPRTWGSLCYMLLSLVTGIVYFTWGITGLSLALGLSILIIGAPFAILFLLSVRGLALVEARLVETLLGVELEDGPSPAKQSSGVFEQLKALVTDRRTWLSLVYLVLQLPLGVVYFSLTVVVLAVSLGFMAIPFAYVLGDPQIIVLSGQSLVLRPWTLIAAELAGFLFLTLGMHLIRLIGGLHGRYARRFLVG